MGCCLSTKKPPPSQLQQQHSSKSSRAPPPVEEETVKEVLSETPTNPKHHFTKNIQNQPPTNNHHEEDVSISSEICSNMSETISTTTTFEEDVEGFRRRVTERSPAKLRNRQNISPVVRNSPPVRGKQQSPGRVRSVSEMNNRGSGFGSTGRQRPMTATREVSRSRSPAGRGGGARNGVGARKMDNSPGRVRTRLPPQKPELSSGIEREESSPLDVNNNEDESIDNPLVSLECFIFL